MIVQCDQCNTRFKLDDAKVKESGVKVRCSKCKHVFIVRKEMSHEETDFDSLLSGLGATAGAAETQRAEAAQQPFGAAGQHAETEAPAGWEEEIPVPAGEAEARETEPPPAGQEDVFTFGDEPFPERQTAVTPADEQEAGTESAGGHEFDFGAVTFDEAPASVGSESVTAAAPADEFEFESFTPGQQKELAMAGTEEEPYTASRELEVKIELPEEAEVPVDFGEIDFGEGVAASAPAEEQVSWDLAGAVAEQSTQAAAPVATVQAPAITSASAMAVTPQDELPPLGISSRRKGSSIVPIALIAIAILFVIALAGAGFYFLKEGPAAFNKLGLGFLAELVGMEAVEEGGIMIRKPVGTFLVNKEGGEIFVVSGDAVNNFKKPRASIQVKATLYGQKGEAIQQKSAYCGNVLSKEQLETLPLQKIEAAMLNQFGDSLANLGVQPGKAIPFVVVFTKVSKDAGEFGVEVIGSTVASQ